MEDKHRHIGSFETAPTFGQSVEGMPIKLVFVPDEPLPFDEFETPLSLVDRLEAYKPKSDLMVDYLIADLPVSHRQWYVSKKRHQPFMRFGEILSPEQLWSGWKAVIVDATGKEWPELAELIYGDSF